jgi:hypothetical protein
MALNLVRIASEKSRRRLNNMTYTITINASTPEELSAIVNRLNGVGIVQAPTATTPAVQDQPSYQQQQAIAPQVIQQPVQQPVQQPAYAPDPSAQYQQPAQQGYGQQTGYTPEQSTVPVHNPQATQQFQQQVQTGQVPLASAPSYTMEQLGVAAGPFVDAGRGPELTAWLQQHGAIALTQLDKAYYGEFATYLRSLGAQI